MKKIFAIMLLTVCVCSAQADNLFQNVNPFPQTMPQDMNNIYESRPSVIQDEAKKSKKSWFRKGENLKKEEASKIPDGHKIPIYPVQHEGVQSTDSFYMFTTP